MRHAGVRQAFDDLRAFGVTTRLEVRWAADGSGVEPDAPRVIHLHRGLLTRSSMPATVRAIGERVVALDVAAVVRHEIGHALLMLDDRAARTARFRALFGDVAARYAVGTVLDEIGRRLTRHGGLANPRYRDVVSLYAASHPHERFAEAVRVALACRGDTQRLAAWADSTGVSPRVRAQLAFASDWLSTYRQL